MVVNLLRHYHVSLLIQHWISGYWASALRYSLLTLIATWLEFGDRRLGDPSLQRVKRVYANHDVVHTLLSSRTCRIKGCAFRNQRTSPGKPISPPAARHTGISQEQLRRKNHSPTSVLVTSESYWAQRRPWAPSFSLAVLLFLVRIAGANIDDLRWRSVHWQFVFS